MQGSKYTDEFRTNALALCAMPKKTITQVAKELNMPRATLYDWVKSAKDSDPDYVAVRRNKIRSMMDKAYSVVSRSIDGLEKQSKSLKLEINNIDKLRLSIYILENKNFDVNFNTRDIIILLKKILSNLDSNYRKTIINFSGYKHLLFFSAKYLELSNMEKKNFTVEMLFNIYEIDFNDETINNKINNYLLIYDYCYAVLNR